MRLHRDHSRWIACRGPLYGGYVDRARLQRWFAVLIFAEAGVVLVEVLTLR